MTAGTIIASTGNRPLSPIPRPNLKYFFDHVFGSVRLALSGDQYSRCNGWNGCGNSQYFGRRTPLHPCQITSISRDCQLHHKALRQEMQSRRNPPGLTPPGYTSGELAAPQELISLARPNQAERELNCPFAAPRPSPNRYAHWPPTAKFRSLSSSDQ